MSLIGMAILAKEARWPHAFKTRQPRTWGSKTITFTYGLRVYTKTALVLGGMFSMAILHETLMYSMLGWEQ